MTSNTVAFSRDDLGTGPLTPGDARHLLSWLRADDAACRVAARELRSLLACRTDSRWPALAPVPFRRPGGTSWIVSRRIARWLQSVLACDSPLRRVTAAYELTEQFHYAEPAEP